MGTDVVITLITESYEQAKIIATKGFESIAKAEQIFSRFSPTSELSRLNSSRILTVSDLFIDVLSEAILLHDKTTGAFNPLIQVAKQGYTKDYTLIKDFVSVPQIETYNLYVHSIGINRETKEITLQADQRLDFGGILKGYLSEKIARSITANEPSCTGVIVNIGGDLHTQGHDADGSPFTFFLFNPITETETPIELTNTSLVTSGTYKRHWQTTLGPRHHILSQDGITNSLSPIISASVIYKSGSVAEAFAKYLISTDPPHIDKKLLPSHLQYYLVLEDGSTINSLS